MVLGLGLAAIGRPAYITSGRDRDLPGSRSRHELRARAHELLDRAYALGIRYVDAARSYGDAEQFLGSWLAAREVPDVFVASKWGYRYAGDWRMDAEAHEVKSHDLATFTRQLAETRALLGDRLRLYQVHSLTSDSPLLADRPLLDRLAALRDEGVEVGFSTSGPRQADAVERALALTAGGGRLFGSVQSTWNLLEPSAGPALAAAHDAGVRVVVKEAVANGRLAGPGVDALAGPGVDARLAGPGVDALAGPGVDARLAGPGVDARLASVAAAHGVGPDAVALAAVAAQPWCDVVLSGAVTVAQLDSNATAVALTPADLDLDALAGLAEPAEAYWTARAARPWA